LIERENERRNRIGFILSTVIANVNVDLTLTGLEKTLTEKRKFGTDVYEYKRIFNEVTIP
jgi:hypothetical protein